MKQTEIRLDRKACLVAFANAFIAIVASKTLANNVIFAAGIAVVTLTVLAIFTKLINYNQILKIFKPR
jgi:hypothetical protein